MCAAGAHTGRQWRLALNSRCAYRQSVRERTVNSHSLPVMPTSLKPPRTGDERATQSVSLAATATLPTRYGTFTAYAYRVPGGEAEHLALVMGEVGGQASVLTRLHSECLTGDVLGSYRCDCGEQLDLALRYIAAEGRGVLLYLRGHEGRGIGLSNKIRAYQLQEQGLDTVEANLELGLPDDAREYDSAAAILRDLNVSSVRLMSNNPDKFDTLSKHGIPVCERVALAIPVRDENERYIRTKQLKFGHYFDENE